MPIEIKELEINVSLVGESEENEATNELTDKEEIIEECIERVLQVLKDKNEL